VRLLARFVWLLTGAVWALRSLMEFGSPDYWDPITAFDWTAVWLYSIAWLLMAPSLLLIGRSGMSRPVMVAAAVASVGCVFAGGANALEDGFGFSSMGTWYVIGFFLAWLALLPLATLFYRAGRLRLAALVVALFAGIILLNAGGGLIVLAALGSLAVMPDWYEHRTTPTAQPVTEPVA
jgi:hypothetical protein